jgi:uncharacterized protein (DUF488 family)
MPVFTIGHSAHPPEHFAALLKRSGVDVVLDVRSSPFSTRAPQYNRFALKKWLAELGIVYSLGGEALGGRPRNPAFYVNGRADYLQMAQTEAFRRALRRVANAARSHRVALLCAEAEPIECHRFLLVGRALHQAGVEVQHILANGAVETQSAAEERMLKAVGLLQAGLFESVGSAVDRAYAIQSARVAYSLSPVQSAVARPRE